MHAVQFAGLARHRTSSSDEKLERARALSAADTIDYRRTPKWQDDVRLTDGVGADLVVDTAGGYDQVAPSRRSATAAGDHRVIPLADVARGYRLLERGARFGKIVVAIDW